MIYEKPINYLLLYCTLMGSSLLLNVDLQNSDPNWYSALTAGLNADQTKELEEVFRLSEQRRAAAGKCFPFILYLFIFLH